MHERTRLVCPEIIYISFEKVRNIFLQDFKDLCTENWGILSREIIKATDK